MRTRRLLWQLYPPVLAIASVSLIIMTVLAVQAMKRAHERETAKDLLVRASLLESWAANHLAQGTVDAMSREAGALALRAQARVTVVLPSGQVVADSEDDPARMDNHGARPEIQAVLQDGEPATSRRVSPTLDAYMLYASVPVHVNGALAGVLRTATPLTAVDETVRALYGQLWASLVLAMVLAALMAMVIARRLSRPLERLRKGAEQIAAGELSTVLPGAATQEVNAVARAVNDMARQLSDRIDALSRQRNELEAVLSSMEEGVVAVDKSERLISINGAAAAMLGIDAIRSQGRLLQEAVRSPALEQFIQRALSSPLPVSQPLELPGETESHSIQGHGAVLRDATGGIIGALAVLHDVSRIRRLERIRRDFVANVSHELRTPVTSIKGFVETLQDSDLRDEEEVRRFLAIIASQADRLAAIIDDLLSLSRLEQDGGEPIAPLAPHAVRTVLELAREACQAQAAAKGIAIELACEEALTGCINPQLLEQAVINLVDNAIKYSESGTRIHMDALQQDSEIVIRVKDEGCGIERKHLSRIFERFYRVDRARSRKLGGTGLGLAIVKHIVQLHGGHVRVDSQPGAGSTFFIHLPQQKEIK